MKQIIILGLFSFWSAIALANVEVRVEPSTVSLDETFKLILSKDSQDSGVPNLVVLQKDFSILGTERQINYTVVNGQAHSYNQWVVLLRPKRTGILTIPSIKLGAEQSNPLTINVNAAAQAQDSSLNPSQNKGLMLLTETDEQKPYVNQQVIYTVKLYNSKRLLDANYQGPEVEDALMIPLGETKRYQSFQNNTDYIVEEQRYAIFPQKSGSLTINSPTFTALVYDYQPKRIKAQDKPLKLSVQPIPKQFQGQDWLPAKQIRLSENYEYMNQTLGQGSTLTRTITIEGVGVPAQFLPTLRLNSTDTYKVYPERGKDENKVANEELTGKTEIKVTYLFNKAGKITIPETKLSWFNTVTGKEEFSTLPPKNLNITPTANSKDDTNPVNTSKNQNTVKNIPSTSVSPTVQIDNKWPWILALAFAIAWVLTMGLWAWQKHPRNRGKGQYKKNIEELKQACQRKDPRQARDAILKWAGLHWPDAAILNLTDVVALVRDVQFKKQIQLLSKVLYKNDQNETWHGDDLLRAVQAIKSNNKYRKTSNPLPPINPL